MGKLYGLPISQLITSLLFALGLGALTGGVMALRNPDLVRVVLGAGRDLS